MFPVRILVAELAVVALAAPAAQAQPTDRYRVWIASQPGFCGGYHLLEPETGHALSLTVWEDDDVLAAAERALRAGRGPADGRLSRESPPTVRLAQVAAVF
jgi:hypothetical protein